MLHADTFQPAIVWSAVYDSKKLRGQCSFCKQGCENCLWESLSGQELCAFLRVWKAPQGNSAQSTQKMQGEWTLKWKWMCTLEIEQWFHVTLIRFFQNQHATTMRICYTDPGTLNCWTELFVYWTKFGLMPSDAWGSESRSAEGTMYDVSAANGISRRVDLCQGVSVNQRNSNVWHHVASIYWWLF